MHSNTYTKTYDIFNMDMSFNISDIQEKSEWRERAMNEAKLIHSKPRTARGRKLNEIYETCLYGHAPEQYLIETGWDDDERPYKDLFDPQGDSVEIKTTGHIGNIPYVLEKCQSDKLKPWKKYPDIVYIFINDKKSEEYFHEGTYVWNEKKYVRLP